MSSKTQSLPQFQSDDRTFQLLQSQWAPILNTLLKNSLVNGLLLENQDITTGLNVINHKLNRKLQGWIVTRMQGAFSELYDTQVNNQRPELTLLLNASADTTCDIYVF